MFNWTLWVVDPHGACAVCVSEFGSVPYRTTLLAGEVVDQVTVALFEPSEVSTGPFVICAFPLVEAACPGVLN